MNSRRIVITGIGAVSCAGNSWTETWNSLSSGRSGIGHLTRFPAEGLPDCAGEVRDLVLTDVTPKEERRMPRAVRFAVSAGDEAMRMAGLSRDPGERGGDPFRFGVLLANGAGAVDEYEKNLNILERRGPSGVSAFFIPKFMSSASTGNLAVRYRLQGPGFDTVSACASSAHAIGEAMWIIRRGDADIMLAGGSEACLTRLMMSGFNSLTALSCHPDPVRACRPFDLNRNGFVLAEGAAVLVLEELEHARSRGAQILAELSGYGATCDGWHITAPDPDARGLVRAMRNAMELAECPVDGIGCISAHGTGTIANDRCEARAIRTVFGERTDRIKVSAIKSMIGHAMGASGALSAAAAVQTLRTGIVPPTINYETPDPECPLDVTPNVAAKIDTDAVMTTSLGFGGHNAVLIFKRWKG
ncbi:MAG: beta-ketoacyl-[acyl-carrier-protein] synthase family protein [Lentisphaeria bacterium]|nr:beta-ketoacyl-[acyl-carrier-protein] synthase family protein [Lentisphaeria bacterium]